MWSFHLLVHSLQHRPDPDDAVAPTSQVPGPVLPELLVAKTIDDGAQEAGDDVDEQEEDVTDLQTPVGEEGDESSLKGGNHKGKHAQQQLKQKGRGCRRMSVVMLVDKQ